MAILLKQHVSFQIDMFYWLNTRLTFFHMSGVLVAYKILETFFNVFLINTHEKSLSCLGKTITIMRKSYNLFAERAT